MKEKTEKILNELLLAYPQLQCCYNDIKQAFLILQNAFKNGGSFTGTGCTVYLCLYKSVVFFYGYRLSGIQILNGADVIFVFSVLTIIFYVLQFK